LAPSSDALSRQKEGDDPYSVKPKSARFGYRDWVAVTIGAKNKLVTPSAKPVTSAFAERAGLLQPAGAMGSRLMACGWAMNNMEAVTYLDAEQPMHLTDDPARMEDLKEMARSFADAADVAASILRIALRNTFFADGAKPQRMRACSRTPARRSTRRPRTPSTTR
jgi:CRISPR system Cascade subunit CasA